MNISEIKQLREPLRNDIDFSTIKLFRGLTEYERGRHEQSEHILQILTEQSKADETEISALKLSLSEKTEEVERLNQELFDLKSDIRNNSN